MRVKFLKTTNFGPGGRRNRTTKYLAGQEATIRREDGDRLVREGKAQEVAAPRRPEA